MVSQKENFIQRVEHIDCGRDNKDVYGRECANTCDRVKQIKSRETSEIKSDPRYTRDRNVP